jgi:hypothetical protein
VYVHATRVPPIAEEAALPSSNGAAAVTDGAKLGSA